MLAPPLHGGPGDRQAAQAGPRERPPDTAGGSAHAEDAAGGKAHATGKAVTAGRRPHRQLRPDPGGPAPQQPPALRGRANKAHAATRHRGRELCRGCEAAVWRDGGPALQKAAASGGAPGTADASAATRPGNSEAWGPRWKTKRSRAPVVRRGALPQATGTARPLGIPALEATLVPLACATRCTAISGQALLAGRDG